MYLYIVMEDLCDGDVALRYFKEEQKAQEYIEANEESCYYESNPRMLDTDDITFKDDVQ